jgi:hypothetical protein
MSATSSRPAIKCRWLKILVRGRSRRLERQSPPMLAAALSSSTPGEKRASSVRRRLIFPRPHCTFPNSERSRPVSAASGFQSKKDEDYRPPSVSHHYPADRRHRTGEAGVGQRCLPGPKWRLEMHHRVFRMVAVWAFEGARIVARRMGLNPREHHHRCALGT